jgi:hypothetical protein
VVQKHSKSPKTHNDDAFAKFLKSASFDKDTFMASSPPEQKTTMKQVVAKLRSIRVQWKHFYYVKMYALLVELGADPVHGWAILDAYSKQFQKFDSLDPFYYALAKNMHPEADGIIISNRSQQAHHTKFNVTHFTKISFHQDSKLC